MDDRNGRIYEKGDPELQKVPEKNRVPIPPEQERHVSGMNRKDRRQWAREQRKAK